MRITILRSLLMIAALGAFFPATAADDDVQRLVAAMLGDTPVVDDLHELTDTIGGRVTGSDANRKAVAWAARKLQQVEVTVTTEDFEMPAVWQEKFVTVAISGDASFDVSAVAKPFSVSADALNAPLLDGGAGSAEDFAHLGEAANGAWVLVETPVLNDDIGLGGLFGLYSNSRTVETNATSAGAAGVVTMSPYPKNLVYRQFASSGANNDLPLLLMEREDAQRAMRLLRSGQEL